MRFLVDSILLDTALVLAFEDADDQNHVTVIRLNMCYNSAQLWRANATTPFLRS